MESNKTFHFTDEKEAKAFYKLLQTPHCTNAQAVVLTPAPKFKGGYDVLVKYY